MTAYLMQNVYLEIGMIMKFNTSKELVILMKIE